MDNSVAYIDENVLSELVLLRSLASLHDQLDQNDKKPMQTEHMAMSSYLYNRIHHVMKEYHELNQRQQENEAIGVVVGRFQVPELHEGHKFILQTVRNRHARFAVALGVPVMGSLNAKNPLTYDLRASMISAAFPDAVLFPLSDCPTDEEWSLKLFHAIRSVFPIGDIRLYGSRDSFLPYYKGELPVTEIAPLSSWNATEIRKNVGKTTLNSAEFRKGIIFASQTHKEKQ